jgi:hypothetical protein
LSAFQVLERRGYVEFVNTQPEIVTGSAEIEIPLIETFD